MGQRERERPEREKQRDREREGDREVCQREKEREGEKDRPIGRQIYIYISIIIKLDLCDIAFLCQASPPKALIVQY